MGPDHLESYLLHVTFWPWFRLWPSPWPLSNPEPELCSWHEHDFVWGQSTCPLTLPETLHMFSVNFNQCFPAVSVQNILYSYTVLPMWPWKLNLERHRFLPIFPNCILSSNVFLLNCVVFDGPAELNKFYNTFEGQDHFLQHKRWYFLINSEEVCVPISNNSTRVTKWSKCWTLENSPLTVCEGGCFKTLTV